MDGERERCSLFSLSACDSLILWVCVTPLLSNQFNYLIHSPQICHWTCFLRSFHLQGSRHTGDTWTTPPEADVQLKDDQSKNGLTVLQGDSPIPPKESPPNPRFIGKSPWPKSRSIPPIPERYMSSHMREGAKELRVGEGKRGSSTSLPFTTLCTVNQTNTTHWRS